MSRNLKLLIILIITLTLSGYIFLVVIPTEMASRSYEGAKAIADDIRKAFGFTPEIRVNNTIVLNQETAVFELAVLQQNFGHRFIWENSWLGSTKKIIITGTFDAKVGFDLHEKFSITLRDDKAYVTLPQPTILSVESTGNISYRDDNGIWNWVSIDDRTRATNAFIRDGRRFAEQAAFKSNAKIEMEKRLKALLAPYSEEVVVIYEPLHNLPGR